MAQTQTSDSKAILSQEKHQNDPKISPSKDSTNSWEELSLFFRTLKPESQDQAVQDSSIQTNYSLIKDFTKFRVLQSMSHLQNAHQYDVKKISVFDNLYEELAIAGDCEEDDSDILSLYSKRISFSEDSSTLESRRTSCLSNLSSIKLKGANENVSERKLSVFSNKRTSFFSNADVIAFEDSAKGQVDLNFLQQAFNPLKSCQNFKKRNSEIIASLQINPSPMSKRRSMREVIHRGSLQSTDLSPMLKAGLDFLRNDFVEAESNDEDSDSSRDSDQDSIISENEQVMSQMLFKLSILNHEGVKFTLSQNTSGSSDSKDLNQMNLLSYNPEDETENLFKFKSNRLHASERRFRKFCVDKRNPNLGKVPFYLLSRDNFVRSTHKNQKNGQVVLQEKPQDSPVTMYGTNSLSTGSEINSKKDICDNEMILSFGSFRFKDGSSDPRSKVYQTYLGRRVLDDNETHQENPLDAYNHYALTIEGGAAHSHIFNSRCLKEAGLQEHCQVKVDFAGSRFPINMYALVFLQYGRGNNKLPVLPSFVLELIASFLREDKVYIRDSGSRRGTFVKLAQNNPLVLKEGMLLMLNNKVGFYVKSMDLHKVEHLKLNRECDMFCLNKKPINEEIIDKFINSLGSKPSISLNTEKLINKIQKNELRELIEEMRCPCLLLEIVCWNEKLDFYEERGGICFLYNDRDYSVMDTKLYLLDYSEKNWCNLHQVNGFNNLLKTLKISDQILLSFCLEKECWLIESQPFDKGLEQEVYEYNKFSMLYESAFDFKSVFLSCNERLNYGLNKVDEKFTGSDNYNSLWVSTSPLDILKGNFVPQWVEVAKGSHIKFKNSEFKLDFQSIKTIVKKTKDPRTESLSKSTIADLMKVVPII